MATKFAAREDLVLATEDDCSGRSNSENREGIDGAIHTSNGKISTEGLGDVGAVMGEAIAVVSRSQTLTFFKCGRKSRVWSTYVELFVLLTQPAC